MTLAAIASALRRAQTYVETEISLHPRVTWIVGVVLIVVAGVLV